MNRNTMHLETEGVLAAVSHIFITPANLPPFLRLLTSIS